MITQKQTRYGLFEFLSQDTCIGRSLELYGEWAAEEIGFLLGLVGTGDVVLDIGANYGVHTISFAGRVGDTGKVHAFEAQSRLAGILDHNCTHAGLTDRVEIHNVIVSDRGGYQSMPEIDYSNHDNFGNVSFGAGSVMQHIPTDEAVQQVETKTIDSLNLGKCDLVKIDAEGMERQVIAGSLETLKSLQPILFFECNDLEQGWDCIEMLKPVGDYEFFIHSSSPFNPDNYNKVSKNLFSDYMETHVVAISRRHPCREYVSQNAASITGLNFFVTEILSRQRSPDHPLSKLKNGIFLEYGTVVENLTQQLSETNQALDAAQGLALERLGKIKDMDSRIAETEKALKNARGLAMERFRKIEDMDSRLAETEEALKNAQGLAMERLGKIEDMDSRIAETEEALRDAQGLAMERLREIGETAVRLDRTDRALNEARDMAMDRLQEIQSLGERLTKSGEELVVLKAQLAQANQELERLNVELAQSNERAGNFYERLVQANEEISRIKHTILWRSARKLRIVWKD